MNKIYFSYPQFFVQSPKPLLNRNEIYPQLTDHYFTGDYPVKPIDELGDNKITQLSLLSTASNN